MFGRYLAQYHNQQAPQSTDNRSIKNSKGYFKLNVICPFYLKSLIYLKSVVQGESNNFSALRFSLKVK